MKRTLLERRPLEVIEGAVISLYLLHDEASKYATWQSNSETPEETYWGHYFDNIDDAVADYHDRIRRNKWM